ncbi:MAG: biotin/lipoyl-containing protein [Planctomycetota bacterium]
MQFNPGEIRLSKLYSPQEEDYVLTKWLVQLGDRVDTGQTIAMIESDSVTLEVCAYDAGCISEMNAIIGKAIPDGALIARVALD